MTRKILAPFVYTLAAAIVVAWLAVDVVRDAWHLIIPGRNR